MTYPAYIRKIVVIKVRRSRQKKMGWEIFIIFYRKQKSFSLEKSLGERIEQFFCCYFSNTSGAEIVRMSLKPPPPAHETDPLRARQKYGFATLCPPKCQIW